MNLQEINKHSDTNSGNGNSLTPRPVGRPKVSPNQAKKCYSVSCSPDLYNSICAKYGTLTKALEALSV